MVGDDGVKRRAVSSQLCQEARHTAWRMVGDDGVKRWAVPSQLKATRAPAWHMVGDDGVKRRAVPRQLETTQAPAWRMVEDDGVKRWAVPRQLLQEARHTAWRMVEDDGVDSQTALASLLHAACTAGSVRRVIHRRPQSHIYSSSVLHRPLGTKRTWSCDGSRWSGGGWTRA
jgi:hypothetical protein